MSSISCLEPAATSFPPFQVPAVEVRDITFQLGGRMLFRGLNLAVQRGERLAIMGMSGSGKSTLLKLLVGSYQNYRGEIRIFGQDIRAIHAHDLDILRTRIGFVFQYGALISSLSVRGNLAFALEELTARRLTKSR